MSQVCIIDYGMGNIHSVAKALNKVSSRNDKIKIVTSLKEIDSSDKIVFPGQGAAQSCINNLNNNYDIEELKTIIMKKPFLGICMGLQVLMSYSDEDNTKCLDIFAGSVNRISSSNEEKIKLPHMGWSKVNYVREDPIWNSIQNNSYFYFVHSYYVSTENSDVIMSYTDYGSRFVSSLQKDNIIAVQFHPEKSSNDGLKFLRNFIDWRI